jgi:serine O-acetyltransferase
VVLLAWLTDFFKLSIIMHTENVSVWGLIKSDLYRHEGLRGFRGLLTGWYKPGFRYTMLWRLVTHPGTPGFFRFFLWLMKRRCRILYGFEIDRRARIGEGFYLSDHVGPIVMGPIRVGKYCNVAHGVTIGRSYKNGDIGRPTLGDRVWIGAGAVLVGKISIGSDVLIAPNSFVNFDVPDNSLVIGNPGRIIRKENPTKYYINHMLWNEEFEVRRMEAPDLQDQLAGRSG